MNKEMLHPNCSEVCWRLDIMPAMKIQEQIVFTLENNPVDEDDYSQYGQEDNRQYVFHEMLETLNEFKKNKLNYKKIELDFTDGGGGGGDYGAVEDCFHYAMEVASGKMKKSKALQLLQCGDDEDG